MVPGNSHSFKVHIGFQNHEHKRVSGDIRFHQELLLNDK